MFDLTGKIALVTGAGRGVGAGIAAALARQGAMVAVNDLRIERAEQTVETIHSADGKAVALAFDVTDAAAVAAGAKDAGRDLGPIDILVNNAGIPEGMNPARFRDMDANQWRPYIDLNLYGVLHCTRAVIDGMCERGWGRVITISSIAGQQGANFGISLYGAGKGAAISFLRHLALEVAGRGVTVNTLALGLMDNVPDSGLKEQLASTIPARRLGSPDDVGAAVVFLASEEAAWLTGQTIGLNGGSMTT
jgi:3-oxoacyl-[acyl-carrier protein] reductase